MRIIVLIIYLFFGVLAQGQNQPGVVQTNQQGVPVIPPNNEADRLMNEIRIHNQQSHTFPEADSTRTQIAPESRANNTTTTTTTTDTTKW